jgi:ribosomal protein S18 acetylase RimI-like enzyme
MKPVLEPRHDFPPAEIGALEERLYDYNRAVTGRGDGEGLAFVMRDDAGRTIGAAAGYSWAGVSELRQMWVDEAFRGQGYGRALLEAFVAEAGRRSVRRIWVASYDFQAPGLYERLGFVRMAEFEGWPEGHVNVILCKTLPKSGG